MSIDSRRVAQEGLVKFQLECVDAIAGKDFEGQYDIEASYENRDRINGSSPKTSDRS
jgi:hypothetical protein